MIALTLAAAGDPVRVDLDKIRAEVATVRAAIEATTDAPLPLEDAVERALATLRHRAESGENSVMGFARAEGPAFSGRPRDTGDVLALMFTIAPDLVEKGLRARLKPACRDGLSLAERSTRAADLRGRLEKLLDREEELAITFLLDDVAVERSVPESPEDVRRLLAVWDRLVA
ncbi:MAG: hypothetical protein WD793_02255 [Steroidobacteraceae bacterium]